MTAAAQPTAVRHSAGLHLFLWTALPGGGAAAGLVLSYVPGWIAALPWFPNQEQITELAAVIGPKATVALAVVGALAGAVVALMAYDDIIAVTFDDDAVAIERGGARAAFPRAEVAGAFLDGKDLVLLGTHGEELARERTDLTRRRLRAGFTAQGYDWHERDPYGAEFTRWIDGASDLSQDANAVLRARQAAIESDDGDDLRDLRRELSRHGVFVRDEKKRQYWRAAPR